MVWTNQASIKRRVRLPSLVSIIVQTQSSVPPVVRGHGWCTRPPAYAKSLCADNVYSGHCPTVPICKEAATMPYYCTIRRRSSTTIIHPQRSGGIPRFHYPVKSSRDHINYYAPSALPVWASKLTHSLNGANRIKHNPLRRRLPTQVTFPGEGSSTMPQPPVQ